MTNEQTTPQQDSDLVSDIFGFPWLLFKKGSDSFDAYYELGKQGAVLRIMGLVIFNSIALSGTIIYLVSSNPFIQLNSYLSYLPFMIAFVFLPIVGFLVHSTAQFLCFRVVSGKGNLTAQCYLNALFATNFVFLYWLTILILYITRLRGIDTFIVIIGGLYLLVPGMISLAAIQKLSTSRFIGGFVLSVIVSIPLYILYQLLLAFLAEGRSDGISVWIIAPIFIFAITIVIFIVSYMIQQRKLIEDYPDGVPVQIPLKAMVYTKSVLFSLAPLTVALVILIPLGIRSALLPDGPILSENSEIIPLEFNVVDAEYSFALDKIVIVSSNPNSLHVFDPVTQIDIALDLSYVPTTVSVGPDGKFAAVGHNEHISYVDLQNVEVIKILDISTNVNDVALGHGWVYASPFYDGDYTALRAVNIARNEEIQCIKTSSQGIPQDIGGVYLVRGNSIYKLHPDGQRLYILARSHSFYEAEFIQRWEIIEGIAYYDHESSSYVVNDTKTGGNIWLSKNGERIFTSQGQVFNTSVNHDEDITYISNLENIDTISHLTHSEAAERIVAISNLKDEASKIEHRVVSFDYESLRPEKTVNLPDFVVQIWTDGLRPTVEEKNYAANGRFVFVNDKGTHYYVIVQADEEAGLQNDFGFIVREF